MQQSLASYSITLGAKMCYVMKAITLEVLEALPTSSTYVYRSRYFPHVFVKWVECSQVYCCIQYLYSSTLYQMLNV